MSVRSEKVDATTAAMNQIDLSATASFNTEASPAGHVSATIAAAQQADSALSEANALSVSSPEHPITRQVAITIRSSLGDLCLRKAKGQWAPTQSALKQMFQVACLVKNTQTLHKVSPSVFSYSVVCLTRRRRSSPRWAARPRARATCVR